jgi:glutathione peroxidase
MNRLHDIALTRIDGTPTTLDAYQDKVLLIVNTASQCGFTPQYAALEALYRKYQGRGFVVLGFPCNQFGAQEPGNDDQIDAFCKNSYGVSFPMFSRVEVNGPNAHPLFIALKQRAPGIFGSQRIKWNFTKFLVDRESGKITRYGSLTSPEKIERDIVRALNAR